MQEDRAVGVVVRRQRRSRKRRLRTLKNGGKIFGNFMAVRIAKKKKRNVFHVIKKNDDTIGLKLFLALWHNFFSNLAMFKTRLFLKISTLVV